MKRVRSSIVAGRCLVAAALGFSVSMGGAAAQTSGWIRNRGGLEIDYRHRMTMVHRQSPGSAQERRPIYAAHPAFRAGRHKRKAGSGQEPGIGGNQATRRLFAYENNQTDTEYPAGE